MAIRLIIGLGNPEKTYDHTYHNAGFLFVDYLHEHASDIGVKLPLSHILKSTVYMNQSGSFIKSTMKKLGVRPEEVLIVHDDSDLPVGTTKIALGRGAAGHHGVESAIQHLKTNGFWRLRIGIRTPDPSGHREKASSFVLKNVSKEALPLINQSFREAISKINSIGASQLK